MKKMIVVMFLISSIEASADEWRREDTIRQAVFTALLIADWAQTRYIAKNSDRFYETNALMGKHPDIERVSRHFLGSLILHTAVAYYLPKKDRQIWQYTWIVIETGYVTHNYRIGIRMKF